MKLKSSVLTIALTIACFNLVGCTAVQTPNPQDPLEGFNRTVYGFNETLDTYMFKPVAKGYRYVTPDVIETGIGNFFANLYYPTVIINQFLQGKIKLAGQDTGRFLLNSTVGIAGLIDVASGVGLEKNEEDFGQTLASWGVGSGAYVVLPFFGPSTMRGTVGRVADWFTNPIYYVNDNETRYALYAMSFINTRSQLLKAESLVTGDKYLFMRDAYLQRREYLANDKKIVESDPFIDE